EAAHGELLARQSLLAHEADRLIVVDDPDGLHPRGRLMGSEGDDDLEDRPFRLAFELDGAMVLLDESSCERETEARAAFAAGDEREEDLLAQRVGHARSVVL